jgi:hypothetical protein
MANGLGLGRAILAPYSSRPSSAICSDRADILALSIQPKMLKNLGNFGSLRSPLSSVLDQAEAGIGKKIAQTRALVD